MKTAILKTFFCTFILTNATQAFSCPTTGDRHDLNLWVCEFETAMILRDKDAGHQRQVELLSTTPEIKKVRAALSLIDDDTCRRFNQTNLAVAFQRILQHQAIPRSLFQQRSEFAAAEIFNESSSDLVDVCESQLLSSKGQDHTYQNLYYFKFGPVREDKHLMIRVTTKWQH